MNKIITLQAKNTDLNKRLDVFISEQTDFSRTKAHKLIKEERVKIDGKIITKPAFLIENEKTSIEVKNQAIRENILKPEKIPLDILFENKDVLVISKQAKIVVHPDSTNKNGTLVNAALDYLGKNNLSNIGSSERPGVVHRLDKDTSGVIIFAKNDKAHIFLAEQFAKRKVKKEYIALVHGNLKHKSGTIDAPISRAQNDRKKMSVATQNKRGKNAITHFEVIESLPNLTLLKIKIETGRTHQIRVHFTAIGHPIIGDTKYGNSKLDKKIEKQNKLTIPRIFLHAKKLAITLPNEKEKRVFSVEIPDDLKELLEILK